VKNIIKVFLVSIFAVAVFFGSNAGSAEKKEAKMKTAIAYYSYTGNTESAAQALAKELGADLIKVEDVERPSTFRAYVLGAFAARKGKSWPIKPISSDLSGYNRIFIGAPIWWGKCAPEINTYIDQADLTGKSVVVFVTMGGSDPKEALDALTARAAAKGGKVVSSFSINTGRIKKEEIQVKAAEIAAQYK
jgi:flavorubredoxin